MILLIAVIGKIARPEPFWAASRFVAAPLTLERGHLIALTTAIVVLEVFIAAAILLWPRSGWPAVLVVATLGLFTVALARLAVNPAAPSCGCLGLGRVRGSPRQETMLAVVRNLGLIVVSCRLWLVARAHRRAARLGRLCGSAVGAVGGDPRAEPRGTGDGGPSPVPPGVPPAPHQSGFTVLELLVVIGVVAVLLAITLPSLRSARQQAKGLTSLSGQRQNLAAVTMYSSDYAGGFPFLGVPGDALQEPVVDGWASVYDTHYFKRGSLYWPTLVYPKYLDALEPRVFFPDAAVEESWRQFRFTGAGSPPRPDPWIRSLVWMTHTTAAAPGFWDGAEPPEDQSLLRGMRTTDVASPSAKGLLLDVSVGIYNPPTADKRISVGMCDGSAAWRDHVVGADGIPPNSVERPGLGAIPWPIMTTRHGVAGRDF